MKRIQLVPITPESQAFQNIPLERDRLHMRAKIYWPGYLKIFIRRYATLYSIIFKSERNMKCNCGKTALYYVGKQGFCGDHKAEAWTAAKIANHKPNAMLKSKPNASR